MRRHHPKNERIKRAYCLWLEEAKRMSASSVDQALAAIAQFEGSTGHRDFAAFHIEQARRFKTVLADIRDEKTGRPLATATVTSRLRAVRAFFLWLAGQPGYKSKLNYSDADYFNPSNHEARIASAKRERPAPSLDQIEHVLATMPAGTDIERRDRALIAFAILTGARDDAIASLSLRHVDMRRRLLDQDARDVRTKFRKTIATTFFPVGETAEAIVAAWIAHLTDALHFGPDDPLFPKTKIALDAVGRFAPVGLERAHWSNADAIRRVFAQAFAAAGLPYFNPHSFRKTLARLGETTCRTPEEFKAWSQNLGHDHVLTTFTSYGAVSSHRQAEIIAGLRCASSGGPNDDTPLDTDTIQRALRQMLATAS